MGQGASTPGAPYVDGTGLSLDDLGGFYRPAVTRKQELNTKTQWLGQATLATADTMVDALELNKPVNKDHILAHMGGPRVDKGGPKKIGFGSASSFTGGAAKRGGSVTSSKPPGSSRASSVTSSAAQGSFSNGFGFASFTGPSPGSLSAASFTSPPGGGRSVSTPAGPAPGLSASWDPGARSAASLTGPTRFVAAGYDGSLMDYPGAGPGGRPSTVPAGMMRPGTSGVSQSLNALPSPRDRPGTSAGARPGTSRGGPKGKKLTAAQKAAEAKRLAEEEEARRAAHWRSKVLRAKRKLYLLLLGYMKWMTVLKKRRRGFAETITVELLPIFLSNALGEELLLQFGGHLKSAGGLAEPGEEAKAKLAALTGGRNWLHKLRAKKDAEAADAEEAAAQQQQAAASGGEPGASNGTADGGPLASMSVPTPLRARGGLRGATPLGGQPAAPGWGALQQGPGAAALAPTPLARQASLNSRTASARPGTSQGAFGGALMIQAGGVPAASGAVGRSAMSSRRGARGAQPQDARSRYQNEIDVIKKITALYLNRSSPMAKQAQAKADLDGMMKAEQVNLQMIANKANARWVEAHMRTAGHKAWSAPVVLEPKTLHAGGVDVEMYKQFSSKLLGEGSVAVMITYLGEDQVIGTDNKGKELVEAAIKVDLWAVLAKLFPHKVPAGTRVMGLSSLDRRVLQVISDVEKAGGEAAVQELKVVLAVDSLHTTWVAEQAAARCHWTLQPHQIIVTSMARFPGMMWEEVTKTFKVTYTAHLPYLGSGTGYPLLSLGWPSHGFTVDASGERQYIQGSTWRHLEKLGVEYIYSTLFCDWDTLGPSSPVMDPSFCGPAIYSFDVKGANMAMQVVSAPNDSMARAHNSVVVAPTAGEVLSVSIPMTDLQTAASRPVLATQQKAGAVWSATGRYLYKLKHLGPMLTGPNAFKIKVEARAPCAYVYLDAADLTSMKGSLAVAVAGKSKGADPKGSLLSKEWLREFAGVLSAQDAQPSFRARVAAMTSAGSPGSAPAAHHDEGADGKGTRLLLFVKDNNASRAAYRLARQFIRLAGDQLTILHIVGASTPLDEGKALLASFSNVMADHQTRRKLVQQSDKLADTMLREVEAIRPDVVILGSEVLSTQAESRVNGKTSTLGAGALTTSVAMTLAKTLQECSLLVVKHNSAGELFQTEEKPGVLSNMKVAVEIQTSSAPLIDWLASRMSPERDKMYLVRPYGLDKQTHKEAPATHRMMTSFQHQVAHFRFNHAGIKRLPITDGPSEGFPPLVQSEKIDLVALIAPSAKVTPQHVMDLVKGCRSNILIWRQRADT